MCLFTYFLNPKIADKDIVCYKLVVRTKIKGVYKSSFQGFEYIIRQLYTNNIKIEFSYRLIKSEPFFGHFVEEGMFHSYASNLYPIILSPLPNCALLKCIIPKGAYYFGGYFDDAPSYASSQIKILEEI
jgi:hypothetical protein